MFISNLLLNVTHIRLLGLAATDTHTINNILYKRNTSHIQRWVKKHQGKEVGEKLLEHSESERRAAMRTIKKQQIETDKPV